MPEITSQLSTALADRYRIQSHLGEDGREDRYLVTLDRFEELEPRVRS